MSELKLHEAIRLGAMVTVKWTRELFAFDCGGEIIASCALGSALVALGKTQHGNSSAVMNLIEEKFPWVSGFSSCPACTASGHLPNIIAHLNDGHLWTREQIADWVETIEQQLSASESESASVAEVVLA